MLVVSIYLDQEYPEGEGYFLLQGGENMLPPKSLEDHNTSISPGAAHFVLLSLYTQSLGRMTSVLLHAPVPRDIVNMLVYSPHVSPTPCSS